MGHCAIDTRSMDLTYRDKSCDVCNSEPFLSLRIHIYHDYPFSFSKNESNTWEARSCFRGEGVERG